MRMTVTRQRSVHFEIRLGIQFLEREGQSCLESGNNRLLNICHSTAAAATATAQTDRLPPQSRQMAAAAFYGRFGHFGHYENKCKAPLNVSVCLPAEGPAAFPAKWVTQSGSQAVELEVCISRKELLLFLSSRRGPCLAFREGSSLGSLKPSDFG